VRREASRGAAQPARSRLKRKVGRPLIYMGLATACAFSTAAGATGTRWIKIEYAGEQSHIVFPVSITDGPLSTEISAPGETIRLAPRDFDKVLSLTEKYLAKSGCSRLPRDNAAPRTTMVVRTDDRSGRIGECVLMPPKSCGYADALAEIFKQPSLLSAREPIAAFRYDAYCLPQGRQDK
jgi:hypothetical protein